MSGKGTGGGRTRDAATGARPPGHSQARPHWLHFAGHLTEFRTLERPTFWLAVLAAALAPFALLTLLLPLGSLPAVPLRGMPEHLPEVVLWVGAITQAIGWWYLLVGGSLAPTWLRWASALAFVAVQLASTPATMLALATALLTLGYAGLAQRGVLRGKRAALAARLVVLLFYGLLWASGPTVLADGVLRQRPVFYFLVLPLILYSGVDLGETGLFLTRVGLWHLHPRVAPQMLWWIALGLVVTKFALMFHVYPLDWNVGVLCLLLAVGAWCTSRFATHGEPPELFVMALTLVFFLGALGIGQLETAVAALAAAVVLLVLRGRGPTFATIGVYLLLFGLWIASQATEYSLDEVITLAAFADLLYLRLRGPLIAERVMLVVFWVVGFSVLNVTYDLLMGLSHLTRGIAAAVVLLLFIAVIHDIATSGSLLNHGSERMPRSARILMYLGYALVSAGGTVLANGPSGSLGYRLDIDPLQLSGLIILGMPLFLQQFLHAFSFGHHQQAHPEEPGAHALERGGTAHPGSV